MTWYSSSIKWPGSQLSIGLKEKDASTKVNHRLEDQDALTNVYVTDDSRRRIDRGSKQAVELVVEKTGGFMRAKIEDAL